MALPIFFFSKNVFVFFRFFSCLNYRQACILHYNRAKIILPKVILPSDRRNRVAHNVLCNAENWLNVADNCSVMPAPLDFYKLLSLWLRKFSRSGTLSYSKVTDTQSQKMKSWWTVDRQTHNLYLSGSYSNESSHYRPF